MDLAIPYGALVGPQMAAKLDRAAALGPDMIRVDLYSQNVEAEGWAAADAMVDAIRARGIRILLILNGPRGWNIWETREQRIAWAQWAREAVARYEGRIWAWQVANEPNNRGNSSGVQGMPAALYADLLKRTGAAIRSQSARPIVMAGISPVPDGTPGNGPAVPYVRALAAAGIADFVDVLACHVYSGTVLAPAAGAWQTMLRVRAELPLPVWITELGASTGGSNPCTEQFQADLVRSCAAARPTWLKRLFWYTLDDTSNGGTAGNQGGFGAYRLDATPKPVAAALRSA